MARASDFNAAKDPESHAAIYKGVTATQLATVFGVTDNKVGSIIGNLKPCGVGNRGAALYKIRDAAQYLAQRDISAEDLADTIRRMHPSELPLLLRKEYWQAEKLKQEYEIKAGDLWSTAQVIEYVGEFYKLVKMSAQLMSDSVERTTELSDRQRALIKQSTDGMLEDLRGRIEKTFANREKDSVAAKAAEGDDL